MAWKPKPEESVGRDDFRERPGWAIWNSLLFLLMLPFVGAAFAWKQVRGTGESVVGFVRWVQFDYVLPPAIRDTVQWTIQILPEALGLRDTSKFRQVTSSVVVLAVAFVSTLLTGGLAVAVYVAAAVLLGIGLGRFVPAGNKAWKNFRERLPVKDDYNVPRWSRE